MAVGTSVGAGSPGLFCNHDTGDYTYTFTRCVIAPGTDIYRPNQFTINQNSDVGKNRCGGGTGINTVTGGVLPTVGSID